MERFLPEGAASKHPYRYTFYCASQHIFYKLKLWQPCIHQIYQRFSSNYICSLTVSVTSILVIFGIFQIFYLLWFF